MQGHRGQDLHVGLSSFCVWLFFVGLSPKRRSTMRSGVGILFLNARPLRIVKGHGYGPLKVCCFLAQGNLVQRFKGMLATIFRLVD